MDHHKNDIAAIILKNEHDACTPEELDVLEQWYNSLDDTRRLEKFENSNTELKKNSIWETINAKIEDIEPKKGKVAIFSPGKSVLYYISGIAAIFILIAVSYFIFNSYNNKAVNVDKAKYISQINNTLKPKKIILPDNSLVWLESKSSIKYPEHFTNTRSVWLLAGKLFFNIAHDSSKPFIVKTEKGLQTTVLGTAFVIEKDDYNSSIKVSVLRGKVQVADDKINYATLIKNQSVDVNTNTHKADHLAVDSLEMTGWFKSKVVLNDVTLKEVATSIKENFGYLIHFSSPELSAKPCSITYNSTDNVADILLLLDKIYNTKHTFTDSAIYVKPAR